MLGWYVIGLLIGLGAAATLAVLTGKNNSRLTTLLSWSGRILLVSLLWWTSPIVYLMSFSTLLGLNDGLNDDRIDR